MAASIIVQTADCQWVSGYVLRTDQCSELLGERHTVTGMLRPLQVGKSKLKQTSQSVAPLQRKQHSLLTPPPTVIFYSLLPALLSLHSVSPPPARQQLLTLGQVALGDDS